MCKSVVHYITNANPHIYLHSQMPTTSHFNRTLFESDASAGYTVDWANRPIFLLRGLDRCGLNTYHTPASFPASPPPASNPPVSKL